MSDQKVLHIPYMTKQMRRWAISARRDVILRRQVTYQERYKAILGVGLGEVCPHLHKTYHAAECCRDAALNKQAITADADLKGKRST